jgi:plasmid stabilization system protein ParE
MALEIKWSPKASKSLYQITTYLEERISDKSLLTFFDSVFNCLDKISEFPEIGAIENEETNLRSFLISKQHRVFYRTDSSKVTLVAFVDTRTNPKKYPK